MRASPQSASPSLTNTVIMGNTGGVLEFYPSDCGSNLFNNAFSGGTGTNEDLSNPSGTACSQAQIFVDAANGDYHPEKGNPRPCTLVDQGTLSGAPDHDLDGTARPQPAGGSFDIGAYEAL